MPNAETSVASHQEEHRRSDAKHKHLKNVDQVERWLSIGLGTLIALLARRKRSRFSQILLSATGGGLVWRGVVGHCPIYQSLAVDSQQVRHAAGKLFAEPEPIHVHKTLLIRRPLDEVYAFCSLPANLQLVVRSAERVERLADGYQRWYLRGRGGFRFSCDIEITEDQENNHLISWRSRPNAPLNVQGFLSCKKGRDSKETEVRASLSCDPPLGVIGNLAARSTLPIAEQLVAESLRRLRQILEAKELPTIEGQTSGRAASKSQKHKNRDDDSVSRAQRQHNAEDDLEHELEDRVRRRVEYRDSDGRILH